MYRLWKAVAVVILTAAIVVCYASPQWRWLAGLVVGLWVMGFEVHRRQRWYKKLIRHLSPHEIPIPPSVWGAFLATAGGFLVALLGMHFRWPLAIFTAVASVAVYAVLFILAAKLAGEQPGEPRAV